MVLAGRRPGEDDLARAAGASHRALVEIEGRPMLEGVLRRLLRTPEIARVRVAIDQPELALSVPGIAELQEDVGDRLTIAMGEASPSRSALAALDTLGWDPPALVTTADHALLDSPILSSFLAGANERSCDVCVGLVSRTTLQKRFPQSKRTYVPFRDESFSGANLFALLGPEARSAVVFWQRAEALRKRPLRLAKVFGWGTLVRFALRRLTLEEGFERGSAIIGARVEPVVLPFAEAAVDVDRMEDLVLVREVLAQRHHSARDPSSTNSPASLS